MNLLRRFFLFSLLILFITSFHAGAAEPGSSVAQMTSNFTNMKEIVKNLKLDAFKDKAFSRPIKIAILDNGFKDYQGEIGKSLPANTAYHAGKESEADTIPAQSLHGLLMAEIVTKIVNYDSASNYELHLFNTYGYTKFADAVDNVIRGQFDVVLYSQVWEYGGNGDGKGYIDALVDKATAAGVIWINAAGNFGRTTKLAPVDGKVEGENEWVTFKENGRGTGGVKIQCQAPQGKKCDLRLVLSWNDFKDTPELGTDKDLDLYLYDSKNHVVASSERKQRMKPDPTDHQVTVVPRELIETSIAAGTYRVRVKISSPTTFRDHDQLRLTASGKYVAMQNPSIGETLLPPADSSGVITVGASDDIQTSTSKKLNRPDVSYISEIHLKDGSVPFESSTAAAMAAGLTVLNLGTGVEKTRDAVLEALKKVSKPIVQTPAAGGAPEHDGNSGQHGSAGGKRPPVVIGGGIRRSAERTPATRYIPEPDGRHPITPVPTAPGGQGGQQVDGVEQGVGNYVEAPNCLHATGLPYIYPAVQQLITYGGGRVVIYGERPAILFYYDFALYNRYQLGPFQKLVVTPQGVMTFDERQGGSSQLPVNDYEIISSSVAVCE